MQFLSAFNLSLRLSIYEWRNDSDENRTPIMVFSVEYYEVVCNLAKLLFG